MKKNKMDPQPSSNANAKTMKEAQEHLSNSNPLMASLFDDRVELGELLVYFLKNGAEMEVYNRGHVLILKMENDVLHCISPEGEVTFIQGTEE